MDGGNTMTGDPADDWLIVVPVKGGTDAKSRLVAPVGVDRHTLALAFSLDTVAAAVEAVGPGRVYAVTASEPARRSLSALGAHVVRDLGGGLNAAVRAGLEQAQADRGRQTAVAVLLADLPAVRVEEIRLALHAAARTTRAVVPDAAGVGSVLITALGGATLEPRFGPDSAARHVEAGHHRIGLDLVGLRADVDDAASLRAAIDVGVGRHTAAVLAGQPALG